MAWRTYAERWQRTGPYQLGILMDEQKERQEYEMGKSAMKHALSWHGWGSPVGLGLFLVAIGIFLVLLSYAGLIG